MTQIAFYGITFEAMLALAREVNQHTPEEFDRLLVNNDHIAHHAIRRACWEIAHLSKFSTNYDNHYNECVRIHTAWQTALTEHITDARIRQGDNTK